VDTMDSHKRIDTAFLACIEFEKRIALVCVAEVILT